MNSHSSRSFSELSNITDSALYKSFLKHLVTERNPIAKVAAVHDINIAEQVMVKAFSEELNKLAFGEQYIWPVAKALGGELAMQEAGELVGRLTGTSHRSQGELLKNTATNGLIHLPFMAAAKYIPTMKPGWLQSAAQTVHDYGSWSDPMSYSLKGRALEGAVNTGIGMAINSATKKPEGLSQPKPMGLPAQPSYEQLRATDPRIVSQNIG